MGAAKSPAPKAASQGDKAKQRIRALDLIQKHTPETNAREAQKTRWIVELVMKVDECYRQEMQQQQEQITQLQQQLADVQVQSGSTIQQLEDQVQSLQATVTQQEAAAASTQETLEAAQVRYTSMQECLHSAEEAAAAAVTECASLVGLVQCLIDQEARTRSAQAHRAHSLREALLQTQAALRRAADTDRKAHDDREVRLRQREQVLTAERAALLEQQSIHAARDEALETLQLKYHLSVCKIHKLLNNASQQAHSAAAAISNSVSGQQLPSSDEQQHSDQATAAAAAAAVASSCKPKPSPIHNAA